LIKVKSKIFHVFNQRLKKLFSKIFVGAGKNLTGGDFGGCEIFLGGGGFGGLKPKTYK